MNFSTIEDAWSRPAHQQASPASPAIITRKQRLAAASMKHPLEVPDSAAAAAGGAAAPKCLVGWEMKKIKEELTDIYEALGKQALECILPDGFLQTHREPSILGGLKWCNSQDGLLLVVLLVIACILIVDFIKR